VRAAPRVLDADLGYTFTSARHDPAILARSLIAVIAVPVLLLVAAPAMLRGIDDLVPPGSADAGQLQHNP
jgi:hypothetical protein